MWFMFKSRSTGCRASLNYRAAAGQDPGSAARDVATLAADMLGAPRRDLQLIAWGYR